MKKLFTIALLASFTTLAAPLQWVCDWPEAKSQTFSLYQGETATFEPTFRVNGRTVTNATIEAVWYQTNGMGNAWWRLDGATFAPSNDVGAASYRFFVEASVPGSPFPVPQTIYRANGALRMLPSPGFTPNAIEPPIVALDFSTIEVANAPYYDKAETEAKIVELAPAPGDYATVSNKAMTALQSFTETDPTVPAWAKSGTQPLPPSYATISNRAMTALQSFTESDPTIHSWAKAAQKPAYTAAEVSAIPTTGGVFNASLHLNQKLSVGTWTSSVKPYDISGGSGIAFVFGDNVQTKQSNTMTLGVGALNTNAWSFIWNGDADRMYIPGFPAISNPYATRHNGGFHVNPSVRSGMVNPLQNFWIGDTDLATWISMLAPAPGDYATVSNKAMTALQSFTESDPTIYSWAKAAQKPTYTAAEVGATTAEDIYRLIAGTNVVLVVTNYNSAAHAPAMKLQHLDPQTGQYVTYWDETRRHGMTLTNAMNYTDAQVETRAPRAWSGTTSGLGAEAPAGVTWISTPETVIAGGYEYEKVVTSAGAVWVLTSNGLSTGATTNAFFRVSASDGTELFSIEKTDSYLLPVSADGITKRENTVTIPVNVAGSNHPYIRACTNLVDAVWIKEDENGFSCPWASVAWSGSTGAYVATVTCAEPQAFFYFEYMVEGVAKVKNTAKTELSGGIIFNGTTYMPQVNGNKLEFIAQ